MFYIQAGPREQGHAEEARPGEASAADGVGSEDQIRAAVVHAQGGVRARGVRECQGISVRRESFPIHIHTSKKRYSALFGFQILAFCLAT